MPVSPTYNKGNAELAMWNDPTRRIERARETRAALDRFELDPSLESIAALHSLHAEHLREDGDLQGAAEAEARAKRVESMPGYGSRTRLWLDTNSPSHAHIARAVTDSGRSSDQPRAAAAAVERV
jgi:hypothetical protein